jgi:hypothetical protein
MLPGQGNAGKCCSEKRCPGVPSDDPRASSRTTRACTMRAVPPIVRAAIEVIIGGSR